MKKEKYKNLIIGLITINIMIWGLIAISYFVPWTKTLIK